MIAQEEDIYKIKKFIEQMIAEEGWLLYLSPLIIPNKYEELFLRHKLFSFSEDFFCLMKGENIEGLLSIQIPLLPSYKSAIIKIIYTSVKFLDNLMDCAFYNFPFLSVAEITKVKIYEDLRRPFSDFLKTF